MISAVSCTRDLLPHDLRSSVHSVHLTARSPLTVYSGRSTTRSPRYRVLVAFYCTISAAPCTYCTISRCPYSRQLTARSPQFRVLVALFCTISAGPYSGRFTARSPRHRVLEAVTARSPLCLVLETVFCTISAVPCTPDVFSARSPQFVY